MPWISIEIIFRYNNPKKLLFRFLLESLRSNFQCHYLAKQSVWKKVGCFMYDSYTKYVWMFIWNAMNHVAYVFHVRNFIGFHICFIYVNNFINHMYETYMKQLIFVHTGEHGCNYCLAYTGKSGIHLTQKSLRVLI